MTSMKSMIENFRGPINLVWRDVLELRSSQKSADLSTAHHKLVAALLAGAAQHTVEGLGIEPLIVHHQAAIGLAV